MKSQLSFKGAPRGPSGIGHAAIVAIMFASLMVGCGGPPDPQQCQAGATQSCTCPNGMSSRASCGSSGQWGACACVPTPPDMAPTCSGQIDELQHCCHGDDCCAPSNHSQASGGLCVCDSGYVPGPDFSSTNHVCVVAKPDLQITGGYVSYTAPTSPTGTMWICLNRNPDGTNVANGNYVEVKNTGMGASSTFHVALGIQSLSSGQPYYCISELRETTSLAPNETARWEGPFCCNFSTSTVPTGNYRLLIYADADEEVTESNETNNFVVGNASFYVP